MTRSIRSVALYSVSLACLLLGACGKHAPAPPAGSPAAARTTATAPTAAKPTAASTSKKAANVPPTPAIANTTVHATVANIPVASATAALSVASVTLGNAVNAAHQVSQAGNRFAASDKIIYASVATTGRSDGATLNAKWSYLEGNGQLISSISQALATDGPAVTTFMVQNPDLWPEGHYKIEISLDGKPVTTQNFEISKH
jgi:pyruvate/2-oxoglutarate dehydrogenase complex dihydrolipoamide acyltransferase (E2) component